MSVPDRANDPARKPNLGLPNFTKAKLAEHEENKRKVLEKRDAMHQEAIKRAIASKAEEAETTRREEAPYKVVERKERNRDDYGSGYDFPSSDQKRPEY